MPAPNLIFFQKLGPGTKLTMAKVWNRYLFKFFAEFTGQFCTLTSAKQQQNHRVAKLFPILQNEMDSLTLVQ